MEQKESVREAFEGEIEAVICCSVPSDVFTFLKEQEDKRLITLYAGTYSFDVAADMCKGDTKATFYFYLNGYKYGYALSYFQGRFKLERDENIFSHKSVKRYSKKALSNRRIDKSDMRSGEYYEKHKGALKNELTEGLIELILTFVCFIVGFGFLAIFNLTGCDTYGNLAVFIGGAIIAILAHAIYGIIKLIKAFRKKRTKRMSEH